MEVFCFETRKSKTFFQFIGLVIELCSVNNCTANIRIHSKAKVNLSKVNANWGNTTYQASKDFNILDNTIQNTHSLLKFKTFLKKLPVKNCIERD